MAFEKVNDTIKAWGGKALRQAKSDGRAKNIRHRDFSTSPNDSLEAMTITYRKKAGDLISAIVFNIRRTLFYVRNGAGRGHGGTKGSNWTNAAGERMRTNPDSLGKAGISPRIAKDFLKEVDDSSSSLIDDVAEATMDEIFNQAFNQK
jgi:hypothetical protein